MHAQVDLNARAQARGAANYGTTGVTGQDTKGADLVPIDDLARRFGLRGSAVRYYEERGLLFAPFRPTMVRRGRGPAAGHHPVVAGARLHEPSRKSLTFSLGLVPPGAGVRSSRDRVEALRRQIERMKAAKGFLEHVIADHDWTPDGCPYYGTLTWGGSASHEHTAHDHS